jgi:cell wall-associated NlpC family hydrolase|uniref:hypothetical protein n=1 Tax=Prosthecobacter sp. TaxID=1965333 RepID=UPI003783E963
MSTGKPLSISRVFVALWCLALVAMAVIAFQPEANRASRLNTVGLVLGLLVTCVACLWSKRRARMACLAGLGALASLVAWPWSIHTPIQTLRSSYVERLQTYEGCLYYWGGESHRGIDCSGLIRRGLIDACFYSGVANADLGLIQHGLTLWWNDTSAKALGEEHQGLTKHLFDGPDLKTLDHKKLQAGDIAVTDDGVHIMAYLGDETWIEADPGKLKVIKIHAPTTTNGWFLHPIKILRWSLLQQ